mmetsp:Transcript_54311/g.129427  ORF Transcript_54311/g.129427 Transcript_54311/m.129427 type:complete len:173 (-) Transcript_54311:15-533(-)
MTSLCILLRHGTAFEKETDPLRPLTGQGQSEASATAAGVLDFLKEKLGLEQKSAVVFHSGILRAQQTAQTILAALTNGGFEATCQPCEGIEPKDSTEAAQALVASASSPVIIIVGHLPHMGKLAATLVQKPAAAGRLGGYFHAAGGVALGRQGDTWEELHEIIPGEQWWAAK